MGFGLGGRLVGLGGGGYGPVCLFLLGDSIVGIGVLLLTFFRRFISWSQQSYFDRLIKFCWIYAS